MVQTFHFNKCFFSGFFVFSSHGAEQFMSQWKFALREVVQFLAPHTYKKLFVCIAQMVTFLIHVCTV